jgi:N-acetyl-anhydromuramyl-L-alanine amidase AmpD
MLGKLTAFFARLAARLPAIAVEVPHAEPDRLRIEDGWLVGESVERIEMHPTWRYAWLTTHEHKPLAIVAHYTATDPGTAVVMARRRQIPWSTFAESYKKAHPGKAVPQNSWHISIEADGSIVQMAPLTAGCWHAGSSTAKPIAGAGWANRVSIGIELVGHGKEFPEAQVAAACDVWRALVQTYGIAKKWAMVTHQELDPGRRSDPGPVWMQQHAPRVIAFAFA